MTEVINPIRYGCSPGKEPEFVEYMNEIQDEFKFSVHGDFPNYTVFKKENKNE